MLTAESKKQETITLQGIRIIIVLKVLKLGGAERQALLLAQHLKQKYGAYVEIWGIVGSPGRVADLCAEYDIPWRIVQFPLAKTKKPLKLFARLIKFAWTLRQAQPDVLLPYLSSPTLACGLVWRWTGARTCIWNQRNAVILGRREQLLERLATRWTPWFVSNSQVGADYLLQTFKIKPERVHVIHNGIVLSRPQLDPPTWRQKLNVAEDCLLVGMVAHLQSPKKDHATLLRAWASVIHQLESEGRSAKLVIVGRFDNAYEFLTTLVNRLEITASVEFLGFVKDITGLMNTLDIYVHSSRFEGCPNAVLEGMAAGLPVIGTDIPGIREAVGPDNYAYLTSPEDAKMLAELILTLAVRPELRAKLGSNNRRRAEKEFSPHQLSQKTALLISQAVE